MPKCAQNANTFDFSKQHFKMSANKSGEIKSGKFKRQYDFAPQQNRRGSTTVKIICFKLRPLTARAVPAAAPGPT